MSSILVAKESFQAVQLGADEKWRAHRVVKPELLQRVMNLVPAAALAQEPQPMAPAEALPAQTKHHAMDVPHDARRAFLVLIKIEGKKLVFLVDQEQTLLLSLAIDTKIAFERGAVFEGYASEDANSRFHLWLTDTLFYCGVELTDMVYSLRKLFVHVMVANSWKARGELDPLVLHATEDEAIDDPLAVASQALLSSRGVILYPESPRLAGGVRCINMSPRPGGRLGGGGAAR